MDSKKKKILLIVKSFPPKICGVGDYTFNLAKELYKRGYEVLILTSKDKDVKVFASKCEFTVLPEIMNWNIRSLWRIIFAVRKNNPDIVILQFVPYMYGYQGICFYLLICLVLTKLLSRSKVIVTLHETYIGWQGILYLVIYFLQRLQLLLLVNLSNTVITTSEYRVRQVDKLIFKKKGLLYLIPVGANIPNFSIANMDKIKASLAPNGEFILTTFGTLRMEKKYRSMLEAIRLYNIQEEKKIKFIVLGNIIGSKEFLTLKKMEEVYSIKDKIIWKGFLEAKSLSKYLQCADLFLFLQEGGACTSSGTLVAAFSHALPILANKGNKTDSIFKHNNNIYFIEDYNPLSVCKALKKLVDEPELRFKLGFNSKETAINYLSWGKIGDGYINVINQMI